MKKKFSIKNNRLAKTLIISGSIIVVLIFAILRYKGFIDIISGALYILRPIIIGGVIAFALNRPMNFFQYRYRLLFAMIKKRRRKRRKSKKTGKITTGKAPFVLACVTTYLVTIAILTAIIVFIVPQLYDSITLFGSNINDYIKNFKELLSSSKLDKFGDMFGGHIDIASIIENIAVKFKDTITDLVSNFPEMLQKMMGFTSDIITWIYDGFMGIVFSVYILINKENLKKNARRLTQLAIKGERYDRFEKITTMSFTTFSNFISGQIIEAVIMAILCFIGMSIIGFDYAPLISVIVGVTNVIPIVGPIIGTIPGAFILLLIKPLDAVWFIIFIIVIQQVDANFIYPRVVGNKVGLPSLWVLVAITIGGGLAGIVGMLLGVPILSIVYALISEKFGEEQEKKAKLKDNAT